MNAFRSMAGATMLALAVASAAWGAADPAAEFAQRFTAVSATVLKAGTSFSFSKVYTELEAIEQLSQRFGADSPERARVLELMSLVRFKHADYAETMQLGEACLALKSVDALAPADRMLLIYRIAESARHLDRLEPAAQHYRSALAFDEAAQHTLLDDSQRLSIRQKLGYVLHEDKRYAEALAMNRATISDAERLFGADDDRVVYVHVNLAQNYYELGRPDEAQAALRRALALAQHANKYEVTDECLFQLGVLAFERGDIKGARDWVEQRRRSAANARDPALWERAEQGAAEMERRIGQR